MENKIEVKDFSYYHNEAYNIADLTARCRYIRDVKDSILFARVDVDSKKEKVVLDRLIEKLEIAHATIEKERKEEFEEKLAKSNFQKGGTKDNFIIWAGSKESLFTLLELLVESKLLPDVKYSEIYNIISSHFTFEGETNNEVEQTNKLRWGKSQSLLAYLICRLDKLNYLGDKYLHLSFSKHFLNKKNKEIDNTYLSKDLSQIKDPTRNKNGKPRNYDIVDDILNVVIGKKLKVNFSYFSRG